MKTLFWVAISTMVLFGWSCENNSDDNSPADSAQVEQTVTTGNWRVTYFNDSGDDETYHFTDFDFFFDDNGTLTATRANTTYTGTWSVTGSNSSDDNPSHVHFNIFFNLTNAFEELNEDWRIVSRTDNRIELIHVSGGNGGTDYLTFERN